MADIHYAQRPALAAGRLVTKAFYGLILKPALFNVFSSSHDGMYFLGKFVNEIHLCGAVDKLERSAN